MEFYRYDEFDDTVMKNIQRLNKTNNIYFGVNPRPISKEKKQDDIKDIICLWADVDGKDFENGKKEALKLVEEFPIEPNIIVDSGHGFHCYWIFKEPIIDISKEARIHFKQILFGIVNRLKADKRPMFLNCLLRLPGTVNIKKEEAKEKHMNPEKRLSFHQRKSGPLMKDLKAWLKKQFEEKKVEPNSGLGEAVTYMLKHWKPLTLFLRVPNAPLDNNLCERALKKAILHRKNALFYKTEHGAFIGDLFMSLIHTCNLAGINPFDYITALVKHSSVLVKHPEKWLPWSYNT